MVKKLDVLLACQLAYNLQNNVKEYIKYFSEEIAQRAVSSRYRNVYIYRLSSFRTDFYFLEAYANCYASAL